MKNKLIAFIALLTFTITSAQAASINVGKKSSDNIIVGGAKTADAPYYLFTVTNVTSDDKDKMVFSIYVPTEIYNNGTYDLAVLPADTSSKADRIQACEDAKEAAENDEEISDIITLPSNDKVYISGFVQKQRKKGKFVISKGITLTKSGTATISLSNVDKDTFLDTMNLAISGTMGFSGAKGKVFLDFTDCKKFVNKSKGKVAKKAKQQELSLTEEVGVIDATGF